MNLRNIEKILAYVVLSGIFLGLSTTTVLADGDETLGAPGIPIEPGTRILAAGTGMETQPGIIDLAVPSDVTVKQVLLYWVGRGTPDSEVTVNGIAVSGLKIGETTGLLANPVTYRADITSLGLINEGTTNTLNIKDMSFSYRNDGASVLVIIQDGATGSVQILDGMDFAYSKTSSVPLQTTNKQTFTFTPASSDRTGELILGLGDGTPLRGDRIDITVGTTTTTLLNEAIGRDGPEWDTIILDVNIPAGETEVSVQLFSAGGSNPDSLSWAVAALSVPSPFADGRMTGGGSVFTLDGARVTRGFEIHCDLRAPNNLEVNWPGGNKFHMLELTSAFCTEDPNIIQAPPEAPFDTFNGMGNGRLNGVEGATIKFVFVDAGEPGTSDTAAIMIWDNANNLVLDVSGFLRHGNLQAHTDNK